MPDTIELNTTTLDDLARLVSKVYSAVSLSDDPTFRWLNVFASGRAPGGPISMP